MCYTNRQPLPFHIHSTVQKGTYAKFSWTLIDVMTWWQQSYAYVCRLAFIAVLFAEWLFVLVLACFRVWLFFIFVDNV